MPETRATDNPNDPYDPGCETFATDMESLNTDIIGVWGWDPDDAIGPDDRILFVKTEEGTYNKENGHFLCMRCYVNEGMPSSPEGWKCP